MAKLGFGTYRISEHNPLHVAAIVEAINGGVKLIDTSTNYMDAEAQRAIAKALKLLSDEDRAGVYIVSKVGYIQGHTLQRHKEKPFEEVVEYSPSCFHSISQSFIKDQITESLENLEVTSVDCLMLHNPEYYILDGINRDVDKEDRIEGMLQRIFDAFLVLEEEVRLGRIKSYGISSNSFAKPEDDEEFLPYDLLLSFAEDAAKELRNKKHSFKAIQIPINLLEQEGLKCAAWAKENGLLVIANRPFNAQKGEAMFRLAEYEEPREYFYYLNELLELCQSENLRPIYNLVAQLDLSKNRYGWVGEYDIFLYSQIVPKIREFLGNIEEKNRETVIEHINLFLVEYAKIVAHECARKTKQELQEEFAECKVSMQSCALTFLLQNPDIDYVLVGARKPLYVADILSIGAKQLKN